MTLPRWAADLIDRLRWRGPIPGTAEDLWARHLRSRCDGDCPYPHSPAL